MPLKLCTNGHEYLANARARKPDDGLCPKCRQAAAFARYLKSEKGRAAVERYRKSEKWQPAVRGQKKRAKERAAEKRAEQQWEAGILPGMKLYRNGLHQYPVDASKVGGRARCPECRRAQRARYRSSPLGRAADVRNRYTEAARAARARYRRSAKGRAAAARYRLKRRTRDWVDHTPPASSTSLPPYPWWPVFRRPSNAGLGVPRGLRACVGQALSRGAVA